MLRPREGHNVAHGQPRRRGFIAASRSVAAAPALRCAVIFDIGKFAVLRPRAGVVPALFADICNGGDLHVIFPTRRTLDGQPVPNVNADMPRTPNGLAYFDF